MQTPSMAMGRAAVVPVLIESGSASMYRQRIRSATFIVLLTTMCFRQQVALNRVHAL